MSDEIIYGNVREFLSHFIGTELVDITQNEVPPEDDGNFVQLLFSNGHHMTFFIHDDLGFSYSEDDEGKDSPTASA